jgi:hypothetical protein
VREGEEREGGGGEDGADALSGACEDEDGGATVDGHVVSDEVLCCCADGAHAQGRGGDDEGGELECGRGGECCAGDEHGQAGA